MSKPFKVGDIVEGEIIDITHEGSGVLKINNFTIFADGGLIGDISTVKITQVKKNYAKGRVMEIKVPSKDRVKPKCPVAHICGGCQLQEISYESQLKIKGNKVKNDIERIGGLKDVKILDTIGMDEPYRYRNKAQFPVSTKDSKSQIGFYQRGSHSIVDTESCVIQNEVNDKVIEIVRDYMDKCDIRGFDTKTGVGTIRHVLTKISPKSQDLMVVIVTNDNKLPRKDVLIDMLVEQIPNIKSIVHNVNNKDTSVILGPKTKVIYGEEKIVDYVGNLKFYISPQSFFQVNPIQTEVLYDKALEYADLRGEETVFDIYCGIGTISLFLAQRAKTVYGIEIVREAIIDAKENAKLNNIENVQFFDGSAEEIFPKLYQDGIRADVILVDPPRKGCDQSVLDTIIKMQPKKVVYVSCNSSTLARDLKHLDENGYRTVEVQPVDMFPHTSHVECVVRLQRQNH